MKEGKEKTIYTEWERYKKEVIPYEAGEVQVLECKRAFAAGYFSAFEFLTSLDLHSKNEDDSVRLISEGHEALSEFIQEAAGS